MADVSQPEGGSLHFYDNDKALARMVAEFLSEGFQTLSPGVVIATPEQRIEIIRALNERSFDAPALQRSHDLIFVDAEAMLSTFVTDGKIDAREFRDQVARLMDDACRGRTDCTVRVFGQMVDLLWRQNRREAAIRLEVLWNQLAQTATVPLIHRYAIGNFYKEARNRFAAKPPDAHRPALERRERR